MKEVCSKDLEKESSVPLSYRSSQNKMVGLSHLRKCLKKVSDLEAVRPDVLLVRDTSSVSAGAWAPVKDSVHAARTEQDTP